VSQEPLPFPAVLQEEAAAIRPGGDPEAPFSALCISGGGIRSATFALGALQSMADHGLLTQFDYLSTVSGGGYIGSWLTAWATRLGGIDKVAEKLRSDAKAPAERDLDPIQHLREYNNYLSPSLGAFSGDTWTLVATVVRNIALNWLVLIPLLLCVLMLPRILFSVAYLSMKVFLADPEHSPRGLADSPIVVYALPVACCALFFFGMLQVWRYLPGIGGINHSASDFVKWILGPLVTATMLFCAYDALEYWSSDFPPLSLKLTLIGTLAPALVSWLGFLLFGSKHGKRIRLFLSLSLAVLILGFSLATAEWLVTNRVAISAKYTWSGFVTIVPPLIALSYFAALALFAGLSSRRLEDKDREWLSRASASILLAVVGWIVACLIVLVAPQWLFNVKTWGASVLAAVGTVSGLASRLVRRDGRAPGGQPEWVGAAIKLAPPIFIVTLAIGLAAWTNTILTATVTQAYWWNHEDVLENSTWYELIAVALGFFAIAWVSARYININKFSLFGMYRDRLIRAYLGASNPMRLDRKRKADEGPNQFTGFAQSDNLRMHELIRRPFHIVNLTLNLVGGQRLAWQQRKAQSFSASPLHCGNSDLGYRHSKEYGHGISLGTAMTISGAAASPNMGYHSSPATGFIMTLLNARLGAWLGNPGKPGEKTWRLAGPQSAVASLMKEALGLTTNESEYVYLSDGGHFENLGLYEMALRRVRSIVVLDAGCDHDFTYEDLGNALRKIRIDLRIPISFEAIDAARRCAVARIEYPDAEPGHILYVKPRLLGDEPPDVTSYCRSNPTFPHQSTADQWFDESQTESYRMLGLFTMESICRGWPAEGHIADFPDYVRSAYLECKKEASAVQEATAS
jgi:hypothetical protein